jgi:glutathione-regulated potassium-efflux system ancillary protein KefG
MARILILFAHPVLEKSRVHARLVRNLRNREGITFRDLYEAYPDFDIDVRKEQKLLLEHDLIILQHPFYWYSAPAMLKQWQDLVLEHGWAYGTGGTMLTGKKILNAISCGGPASAYQKTGRNRFTIRELLAPFDQTAFLCHMDFLAPFVVHGTHRLDRAGIELYAKQYEQIIDALKNDEFSTDVLKSVTYLNELKPVSEIIQS